MAFDYNKLRGRIVEKFGNQSEFANAMGLSERTISFKINGKRPRKQEDILKAIQILGLTDDDIQDYFFTLKVQNN